MDNPGYQQLTVAGQAFQIAGAATYVGDAIGGEAGGPDLSGAVAVALWASFQLAGSASMSPSVTAYVQTSLDQGQTWFDIACFAFTDASGTAAMNLSALTPVTSASEIALTSEGLDHGEGVDGLIGDRFRAVVVVAGTYAGTNVLNLGLMLR